MTPVFHVRLRRITCASAGTLKKLAAFRQFLTTSPANCCDAQRERMGILKEKIKEKSFALNTISHNFLII